MFDTFKTMSLKELFLADPMEAAYKTVSEIQDRHHLNAEASVVVDSDPDTPAYRAVGARESELDKTDPNAANFLFSLNFDTDAGIRAGAKVLGMDTHTLRRAWSMHHKVMIALKNGPRDAEIDEYMLRLKAEWAKLKTDGSIEELRADPATVVQLTNKPVIVFYSANWCRPCQMVKPAYALLSKFWDACTLYFTDDEALARREGATFFPELVAYLPNGSKLFAKTGVSTHELWNTMQKMLEVGQVSPLSGFIDCSHGNFTVEPMA